MSARRRSRLYLAVRVYWEDTDAGGIVFYANYLKFFERARTEWLRSLGIEAAAPARKTTGGMFVVSRNQHALPAPARLDDELICYGRLEAAGRASMIIAAGAIKNRQPRRATRCSAKARSASAGSTPPRCGRPAFRPSILDS
jgi:acyl-CoA thioester hydrolase